MKMDEAGFGKVTGVPVTLDGVVRQVWCCAAGPHPVYFTDRGDAVTYGLAAVGGQIAEWEKVHADALDKFRRLKEPWSRDSFIRALAEARRHMEMGDDSFEKEFGDSMRTIGCPFDRNGIRAMRMVVKAIDAAALAESRSRCVAARRLVKESGRALRSLRATYGLLRAESGES